MLASLLRPKKRRTYADRSPFSSPYTTRESPWPFFDNNTPQRGWGQGYEEFGQQNGFDEANGRVPGPDQDEEEEEDTPVETSPLLPIFSASHLGMKQHVP